MTLSLGERRLVFFPHEFRISPMTIFTERRIEFRIGMHLGDLVEGKRRRLDGRRVKIAARLEVSSSASVYLNTPTSKWRPGTFPN